ncbi:hypothetical protein DSCO28_17660 [Desulfosarcina ovata subsp. sediminis]|uniref:Uncharacterized protein n=1 Tax=Desulfosarcina ovata subsp. sediminis TaxID=885957 RepID=A0A5K7ZPW5_9BACT|nr:hypothetical protein [Desulfosarcina ovata]BBO81200.1 hypothetical protein DSCO28_17660 [Desulfosarcina ovata subsp. sediminis]
MTEKGPTVPTELCEDLLFVRTKVAAAAMCLDHYVDGPSGLEKGLCEKTYMEAALFGILDDLKEIYRRMAKLEI